MAAYSLKVYDNQSKQEQIIKIKENNKIKEKVDITTIDMFVLKNAKYGLDETTLLKSDEDGKQNFINYLNASITNSKDSPIENVVSDDSIIYITYNRDGEQKYLEPVYKSDWLYDVASEFDRYREKYNKYVEAHPDLKGKAKEEYRKKHFATVVEEGTFVEKWINLFYNDLKTRGKIIHEIKSDRKYLNNMTYLSNDHRINNEKTYLKSSLEDLGRNLACLKEPGALDYKASEYNDQLKAISDLKKIINNNFFTHYKVIRGAVIFREWYWNKESAIATNKGREIPNIKETIGSIDVEKAKALPPMPSKEKNRKYKKQNAESKEEQVEKRMNEEIVIIEEDETEKWVTNHYNGERVYIDHSDQMEFERREKEKEAEEAKAYIAKEYKEYILRRK